MVNETRDIQWLILALIVSGGFTGLWRTHQRLTDALVFGKLDTSFESLRARIQRFRWMSLILVATAGIGYLVAWPFNFTLWVATAGWELFTINLVGEGLKALEQVKNDVSLNTKNLTSSYVPIIIDGLPISFRCPKGSQVKSLGSIIEIESRNPRFSMNLIVGRHTGPHSAPPGYTILQKRELPTPQENIRLLVAKSPFFNLKSILERLQISLLLGMPIGYISSLILSNILMYNSNVVVWILGTPVLVFAYFVITTKPKIKYAFVYKDVEYVFTTFLTQQDEMERCISSIEFS